ncbi:MAG TPA: HEAT repeat domain-containing protein [Bryobacteraceae bacterium]|jgi:HEAT repeat protein|nr:HEAT repeat domain-containing protein [Bryobacteraceae bacterium]
MNLRVVRLLAAGCCLSFLVFAQSEDKYSINQRITRIRELGKRDSSVIPALAQYLNDPNRDIRLEAVKAIVKLDTDRSLEPLARAEHDNDPEVQIRATDGLVNYYLPGYVVKGGLTGSVTRGVRQVKSFFASRNDQVIDASKQVRPEVADALAYVIRGSASMDARANAARAAGILRANAGVPALLDALRSKDNEVIFEALVALQKIDDPQACSGVRFLALDLDDRIQMTALETIGDLKCLDCAPQVRSALSAARNGKIRRSALEALAMLGIPEDRSIFQQSVNDRDPEVRAAALEGLGRIREPQDYPPIEQAYNEQNADWRVHLAAAFALVNEGKVDTGDFSPLAYLVENLDNRSRAYVAFAYLKELVRRDDVRRALFPLAPQATKDQKIALCQIFAASKSEDVVPVLSSLEKDIDPDVALAASKALRTVEARKTS